MSSCNRVSLLVPSDGCDCVCRTTATIALSAPFIPVTPFEQKVSDYMLEAWTNFIKGKHTKNVLNDLFLGPRPFLMRSSLAEPTLGPRIPNWPTYSPSNASTLAILGVDPDGATAGNHFETDKVCEFWNEILPIYPQVRDLFLLNTHSLRRPCGV